MAGQIRVTPEQMLQRAGEYRTQGQAVRDVITKMDSLLNQLQGEWEGQASQAFNNRYLELRPGFEKAEDLIQQIASALEIYAKELNDIDWSVARGLGTY